MSKPELLRFQFIDNLATGEAELKLNKAQFCRVRLCPVCQWRRSMAWRARLFQNLPLLFAEKPNLSFIFLTLTVKNCPVTSLAETLKEMNKAWQKLIDRKAFKKAVILAVNKSYFRTKDYIKSAKWAELWQDCLKVDYLPVVDARKIRQKGDQIELKAVLETLKYTTKIEHLIEDKDWFLELSDQLFKKRFIATGGCFKDVLKEEVSNEEMIKGEQNEEFDLEEEQEKLKKSLFFGFDHGVKKYKKVKNPHG
ncbi:protein rep (plasmid) [Avibacterium paragallinarum]|uniref:protein rep n=1 Tax=Avibacterium paragallinarum TaxID=728 RepID=UPI003978111E